MCHGNHLKMKTWIILLALLYLTKAENLPCDYGVTNKTFLNISFCDFQSNEFMLPHITFLEIKNSILGDRPVFNNFPGLEILRIFDTTADFDYEFTSVNLTNIEVYSTSFQYPMNFQLGTDGLKRLKYLRSIKLISVGLEELDEDVFQNNLLLQEVILKQNILVNITNQFLNMAEMRKIDLSSNRITEISSNLTESCEMLQVLNLSFNRISLLNNSMFQNCRDLREIHLRQNLLGSIPDLSGLSRLRFLDLRANKVSEINDNTFKDNTALAGLLLSANSGFSTRNLGKADFKNVFTNLENLKVLDLSMNGIEYLDNKTFETNSKIQYLDLSNNILNGIYCLFQTCPELELLSLSENRISHIQEDIFKNKMKLKSLNLSKNNITVVRKNIFDNIKESLVTLQLNKNQIQIVTRDVFNGFLNLYYLDLSSNEIFVLSENAFDGNDNLEILILSNNKISEISNHFQSLPKLAYLALSRNHIANIERTAFQNNKNLEGLFLENNFIQSIDQDLFKNLEKLRILNLEGNNNLIIYESLKLSSNVLEGLWLSMGNETFFHNNAFDSIDIDKLNPENLSKNWNSSDNFLQFFVQKD